MNVVQIFDGELLEFSFSADGELLLARRMEEEGMVLSYELWDLSEEELLRQVDLGNYVLIEDQIVIEPSIEGQVVIDPSGTYAIEYSLKDWMIAIYYLDGEHPISHNLHPTSEGVYVPLPDISAVAGEYFGDYVAVAFETGQINIGTLITGDFSFGLEIDDVEAEDQKIITRDFRFSLNNEYLIWLTANELIVWCNGGNNNQLDFFLREPLMGGNVVAVDRAGRWLVVGGETGLKFFDLKAAYAQFEEAERVLPVTPIEEFETDSAVTSLYFSRDNRLLIWGDAEGNVHLWGVPLE
jgi:hypothetical protein